MAVALSPDQELATKAFLDALSESGAACVSRATAIKFLLARKFDVARAHALWRQHEATRRREGLNKFEPFEDPLKSELETGKFTILPTRDGTGAAIAVFTANKHFPTQTTHQTTLQGVVYQLDVALQSVDTQRAGLVFIYDMTDSKYTNFDYELSQKILTMLKGGYPAKLKKVLIVTAPLWFKAPFRILRLFVREKLRERVHTVNAPQLGLHVPRASLPKQLGGLHEPDHAACSAARVDEAGTTMGVPHITSFCWCMGLELGSRCIGFLHLIVSLVLMVLCSVFAENLRSYVGTVEDAGDALYSTWYKIAVSVAVVTVVHVLLALTLIYSVHKRWVAGVRAWLVVMVLLWAAALLALAALAALRGLSGSGSDIFLSFLEGVLFFGAVAYCILCVYSYYLMLKSAEDMEGPKTMY